MNTKTSGAKYVFSALAIIAFTALIFFGLIYSDVGLRDRLDRSDKRILDALGSARKYRAHVETQAAFPDRSISIVGDYVIDKESLKFSSLSTTTLSFNDIHTSHTFTLQNIAIGHDIFTKLQTDSSIIKQTMPQTNGWKHFVADDVPNTFLNISIAGPVSDNLQIFSDQGSYVRFIRNVSEEVSTTTRIQHIVFGISNADPKDTSVIKTLFARIGSTGEIHVWIDRDSQTLSIMRFNGPGYISTTTVSHINNDVDIAAPIPFN